MEFYYHLALVKLTMAPYSHTEHAQIESNLSVSCSMSRDHALTLLPVHTVTIPVLSAVTNIMRPPHVPETKSSRILYKTITPYNPFSWKHGLIECNLLSHYPNLICDIKYGSPIGNPPHLSETFIPNNLASVLNNPDFVFSSLAEETASGCMDGPFSIVEAHTIFKGHFCTSPLGVIEKPGSLTHPFHLICHLSKCDSNGCSTNGWLDASEFPPFYFSAARCADFVSILFCLLPSSPTAPALLPMSLLFISICSRISFARKHIISSASPHSLPAGFTILLCSTWSWTAVQTISYLFCQPSQLSCWLHNLYHALLCLGLLPVYILSFSSTPHSLAAGFAILIML